MHRYHDENELDPGIRRGVRAGACRLILVLVASAIGCSPRPSAAGHADPYADIAPYRVDAETTVVIVMAPSDCIACNTAMGDWMVWGRARATRSVVFLLSAAPTLPESGALAATRIHPRDILPDGSPSVRNDVAVYAFARGELFDTAIGQLASLSLVRRMTDGTAAAPRIP